MKSIIKLKKLILTKLIENSKYSFVKIIIAKTNIMKDEYIWYCPRKISCGAIIIKTKNPFLNRNNYKCKRCNTSFSRDELVKNNKKTINKYINNL